MNTPTFAEKTPAIKAAIEKILHLKSLTDEDRLQFIQGVAELFVVRLEVGGPVPFMADRNKLAASSVAELPTEKKKQKFVREDNGKFARKYRIAVFTYPLHGDISQGYSTRKVIVDQRSGISRNHTELKGYDLTCSDFRSFDRNKVLGSVSYIWDYRLGLVDSLQQLSLID